MNPIDEFMDNKFEIAYGAAVGLIPCFILGLFSTITSILCAFLWRLGGMRGHSIRVFGCPTVMWVFLTLFLKPDFMVFSSIVSSCILMGLMTSLGYSVPGPGQEKSSPLGSFFYKNFKGKQPLTDIATRGVIFILIIASFIPVYSWSR